MKILLPVIAIGLGAVCFVATNIATCTMRPHVATQGTTETTEAVRVPPPVPQYAPLRERPLPVAPPVLSPPVWVANIVQTRENREAMTVEITDEEELQAFQEQIANDPVIQAQLAMARPPTTNLVSQGELTPEEYDELQRTGHVAVPNR